MEGTLCTYHQPPSIVFRHYKTWKSQALLSPMPRLLFNGGTSRATQRALHPRRLHVGAQIASSTRIQTGAIEVLQLKVLYYGAICDLCGLQVHSLAA